MRTFSHFLVAKSAPVSFCPLELHLSVCSLHCLPVASCVVSPLSSSLSVLSRGLPLASLLPYQLQITLVPLWPDLGRGPPAPVSRRPNGSSPGCLLRLQPRHADMLLRVLSALCKRTYHRHPPHCTGSWWPLAAVCARRDYLLSRSSTSTIGRSLASARNGAGLRGCQDAQRTEPDCRNRGCDASPQRSAHAQHAAISLLC